jgi:hypothetical protein
MHVLMGDKEKPRSQACMCAPCFELVMSDLSDEFQDKKETAKPPAPEPIEEKSAPLDGPHCFVSV